MNPELDRRLAELADAAARATSGIDPAATLTVFRRRRRARAAASTVAAAAAVVGLALGANHLAAPTLDGTPPALPGPTRSAPSPSPTPTSSETDEPPIALDGPGSCGDWADTHLLSETEGAMLGLAAELMDVQVARDGAVTGYLVIDNNGEVSVTGAYVLTRVRVEMVDGPYAGSVLTLPGDVELSDVVSIAAGGAVREAIDVDLDPCGEGILPLPAGDYRVSADVDLVTPDEPLGFSSPPVEVVVD